MNNSISVVYSLKDLEADQAALTARTGELHIEAADLETQQSNLRVRIQPTEDELARIQRLSLVAENAVKQFKKE